MRIFQHLDELKDSDGVGNDAIGLHTIFNSLDWDSNFITRIPRKGNNLADANFYTLSDSIKMNTSDIHILHYGGKGYPISNFINHAGKKIFRFHNITPADFYKNTTTPEIYSSMSRFESLSYLEIATLSIVSDAAWCDSPFNAYTLQSFNFKKTEILPICKKYNISIKDATKDTQNNICFVGRFAPQKKWEDLITFFKQWKSKHPNSKLYCIGSIIGAFDGYFHRLTSITKSLGLEGDVIFMTGLTDEQVLEKMSECKAMISMSEHEGFCVPLLEAFSVGLPVFAYDAGAIKTTLAGAGYIFSEKNDPSLLSNIESILFDEHKKQKMILKQKQVLTKYNNIVWTKIIPMLINEL